MISIYKRKIWVSILLSVLTLDLYSIYWRYLLIKNVKSIKEDDRSSLAELLLTLFVPFYNMYWLYTRGNTIRTEFETHGHSSSSNGIVLLLLSVFGLNVVALAIMQHDFNSLPDITAEPEDVQEKAEISARIDQLKKEKKDLHKQQKEETEKHVQFNRAAKPYVDAEKLFKQKENFAHFEDIAAQYEEAKVRAEEEKAAQAEEQKRLEAEKQADKERRIAEKKALKEQKAAEKKAKKNK